MCRSRGLSVPPLGEPRVRVFFLRARPPLRSTLFPYTTLFRSLVELELEPGEALVVDARVAEHLRGDGALRIDRKSTRLNSSHITISYAVFCLKKKKKKKIKLHDTAIHIANR